MRVKILSRRIVPIIALAGTALFLVFVFYPSQKNSTNNNSALLIENVVAFPKQEQARSGLPVRLKIPNLNVDAPVEHVGLTSDGAMGVPKKYANTAWFNLGPRPGEKGSAVIDGHFDRKNGASAVFNKLHMLRVGDKLSVEDEKGAVVTFVVRKSLLYGKNDDASAVFGSNDEKAHLNLITCEGVWDKVSKSYSKRLVVFADKE